MRWTALAGLTVVAVVLGYIGFERLPEGDQWSFWDSFHRSVQLFVLESGGVQPPVPWQLEVARFLAPAVTVAAAGLALVALFREQLRLFLAKLPGRRPMVVAGLGEKGTTIAGWSGGTRVIGIDIDENARGVARCRDRGIPVVIGDATDPKVLGRAGLGRGGPLVVTCGEDGTNADVAAAAQHRHFRDVRVLAHLDDFDLWRHLGSPELNLGSGGDSYFNLGVASAHVLVATHRPFAIGEEQPHLVVAGVEGVGESVVIQAARQWLAERTDTTVRMRLTVVGADAPEQVIRLLARQPGLEAACEVQPCVLRHGSVGSVDGPPPTAVYVCAQPEGVAISTALTLRGSPGLGSAPIVVLVSDETRGIATALERVNGVIPFGVLNHSRLADITNQGVIEILARAKHAQYVRDELRRGSTVETNPSMVPWHELEESLRESNRRFAAGIGDHLSRLGLTVVPGSLADPSAVALRLPDEQVEELARAEHDRWMRDLIADGWQYGAGPKDPERKLHPSLVAWEELSEDERDKDREPIRALPEMLALVGFELRPASEEPVAGQAQPALP